VDGSACRFTLALPCMPDPHAAPFVSNGTAVAP
jgi:hypothetical protein